MIKLLTINILASAVLLLTGLTACTAPTKQSDVSDKSTQSSVIDLSQYSNQRDFCPKITEKIVEECTATGGTLQQQGKAQCYTCTIEYKDSGRACSGSADCMGDCFNYGESVPLNIPNQTGQCARDNVEFGCHQKIENGMSKEAMVCVD